ncbi:MAG: zinc-binding dehydrogenase [Planctomycetes bacterium]|nr:zinc-binding dehydrogenase [Planctomycetota bacterium]
MPFQTHAAVFEAPSQVVVRPVEVPDPTSGDVVIDTITSWISPGTELSTLRGDRIHGDTSASPTTPYSFPRVGGYQKIGRVVSVGSDVTSVKAGQVVFATISKVSGMFDQWAGHVKRGVYPEAQVYPLPAGTDPEPFSGAVLTQVGFNAGSRAPVEPGELAVVLGDGLVGLWTAQTLQHRGAKVWIVGRHEDRLAKFKPRAGSGDRAILQERGQSVEGLKKELKEPIAVLVETVSSLKPFTELVQQMKHNGHLVCTAFYGLDDAIHIPDIRCRELSVHTPAGWSRDRLEKTIALLGAGKLDAASMVTHRLPYTEAARAYRMLSNHEDHALGVLLQWPND